MKKYIFKIIRSKILFFLLITLSILSLNLTPLITFTRHSPPGRTFASIHNNVQDFFFYKALMNEGASGQWLTTDPFTTEPHKASIVFSYFLWLGKLSSILHLDYNITYHATRVIFGFLLFFMAFKLILALKIPYPRLSYIFFVFAGAYLRDWNTGSSIIKTPFMHWWTGMDAIRRAAYLPHHMIGGFLLITIIYLLVKFSETKSNKYIILSIVLTALLAFILTPALFLLLLSLPPAIILYTVSKNLPFKKPNIASFFQQNSALLFGLFVILVVGAASLLFMYAQTNLGFPWSQYIAWERNMQFGIKEEIFGAFGILTPFAFLGLLKALISKKFGMLLIASWFVMPLIFIPIAPMVGMSNSRVIQGVPYLPLSILAGLGIKFLLEVIQKILLVKIPNSKIPASPAGRQIPNKFQILKSKYQINFKFINSKIITNFVFPFTALIIFGIFTYPTLKWSINDQIREYWPIFGNVYLDNRLYPAFDFINKTFPKKAHALSTFYAGNMLPAFTHTVSFTGHFGYTSDYQRKEGEFVKFFANKMSEGVAKDFLLSNKIDLVFQGPEEKPYYNNYLYPGILKTVYDWGDITIYTLR